MPRLSPHQGAAPKDSAADPRPSLVWFRHDLRLGDNPALWAAVNRGAPVVCLYVLDDETPGDWAHGSASRWWLHHGLRALAERGR